MSLLAASGLSSDLLSSSLVSSFCSRTPAGRRVAFGPHVSLGAAGLGQSLGLVRTASRRAGQDGLSFWVCLLLPPSWAWSPGLGRKAQGQAAFSPSHQRTFSGGWPWSLAGVEFVRPDHWILSLLCLPSCLLEENHPDAWRSFSWGQTEGVQWLRPWPLLGSLPSGLHREQQPRSSPRLCLTHTGCLHLAAVQGVR